MFKKCLPFLCVFFLFVCLALSFWYLGIISCLSVMFIRICVYSEYSDYNGLTYIFFRDSVSFVHFLLPEWHKPHRLCYLSHEWVYVSVCVSVFIGLPVLLISTTPTHITLNMKFRMWSFRLKRHTLMPDYNFGWFQNDFDPIAECMFVYVSLAMHYTLYNSFSRASTQFELILNPKMLILPKFLSRRSLAVCSCCICVMLWKCSIIPTIYIWFRV